MIIDLIDDNRFTLLFRNAFVISLSPTRQIVSGLKSNDCHQLVI